MKFLAELKKYFDSIWYSQLTAKLSVASFLVGAAIVCVCLFAILPIGEIATSALQAAGMFLVLSGAFGGVKVTFDVLNQKFSNQINALADKIKNKDDD